VQKPKMAKSISVLLVVTTIFVHVKPSADKADKNTIFWVGASKWRKE